MVAGESIEGARTLRRGARGGADGDPRTARFVPRLFGSHGPNCAEVSPGEDPVPHLLRGLAQDQRGLGHRCARRCPTAPAQAGAEVAPRRLAVDDDTEQARDASAARAAKEQAGQHTPTTQAEWVSLIDSNERDLLGVLLRVKPGQDLPPPLQPFARFVAIFDRLVFVGLILPRIGGRFRYAA